MFRKISSICCEIWGGVLIGAGVLITANTVWVQVSCIMGNLFPSYTPTVSYINLSSDGSCLHTCPLILAFVLELLSFQQSNHRQIHHNDGKRTCRGTVYKFVSTFVECEVLWTILDFPHL